MGQPTARVQYDYGAPAMDANGNVNTGNQGAGRFSYGGSRSAAATEAAYGQREAEAWDSYAPNGRQMIDTTRQDAARRNVSAGWDDMVRGQGYAQQQAEGRAPSAAMMQYGQGQEAAAMAQAQAQASGSTVAAQAGGAAQAGQMGARLGAARAGETGAGREAYMTGAGGLRQSAMSQGQLERGMAQAEVDKQYEARGLTDEMSEYYRRQRQAGLVQQMQGERFGAQNAEHWRARADETRRAVEKAERDQTAAAMQAGAGALEMAGSMGTQGSGKVVAGASRV